MEPVARYLIELVLVLAAAIVVTEVLALAFLGLRRLFHRNWGPHTPSPGLPAETPA